MATNENILKAISKMGVSAGDVAKTLRNLCMINSNLNPSANSMILKYRLQMIGVNLQCALDYELPPAKLSDHLKDCFGFIIKPKTFVKYIHMDRTDFHMSKIKELYPVKPLYLQQYGRGLRR